VSNKQHAIYMYGLSCQIFRCLIETEVQLNSFVVTEEILPRH